MYDSAAGGPVWDNFGSRWRETYQMRIDEYCSLLLIGTISPFVPTFQLSSLPPLGHGKKTQFQVPSRLASSGMDSVRTPYRKQGTEHSTGNVPTFRMIQGGQFSQGF